MGKIKKRGIVVAIIYVLSAVTLGEISKRINASKSWDKPILTLWFNHLFLAIVPGFVLVFQAWTGNEGGVFNRIKGIIYRLTVDWHSTPVKKGVCARFYGFTLFIAFLLFGAAGCWIEGLQHASVTDFQSLAELVPVFTIIMSFILIGERLSILKLFAVAVSLTGVALFAVSVTRGDSKTMDVVGVFLGLGFALGMACYCVIVKRVFGSALDLNASVLIVFFIGLANIFPLSLIIPLNDATGFEPFAIPGSWSLFGMLCLNAVVGVVVTVSHLGAVALIGPSITNIIGISQIAVAAVVDYILYGDILSVGEWMGCLCIVIGVLLTVLDGYIFVKDDDDLLTRLTTEHSVNQATAGDGFILQAE